MTYRYRLFSTGHGSSRFGPCEVCREHCAETFFQQEEREYAPDQWTHYQCHTLFGHETCLKAKQRDKSPPPATDITEAGAQYVIPGAEKKNPPKRVQLDMLF